MLSFTAIWRDGGRAFVLGVVVDGSGIHQKFFIRRAATLDQLGAQRRRAHALRVILQAHNVAIGQRIINGRQQPRGNVRGNWLATFHIKAKHFLRMTMLRQANQTFFHSGWPRCVLHKMLGVATASLQQFTQRLCLRVRACHANALHRCAQSRRAQRNIAGAAGSFLQVLRAAA